jgi:hypothetical protein
MPGVFDQKQALQILKAAMCGEPGKPRPGYAPQPPGRAARRPEESTQNQIPYQFIWLDSGMGYNQGNGHANVVWPGSSRYPDFRKESAMTMFKRVSMLLVLVGVVCLAVGVSSSGGADAPVAKLVIVKAVYGDLPDGAKTDVTEKVKGMVKDGALSVVASNDNFGDPAEGVVKKLKVDYTFEGKAKSKTVDEDETLTISDKGE